jgi:predicted house-cleaning noncanonical NTP pyrophosphatase (MazG superfamily)
MSVVKNKTTERNKDFWDHVEAVTTQSRFHENYPELMHEIGAWAAVTFPDYSVQGKLEHLEEEVLELMAQPDDLEEWADCFILLFDAARKKGLSHTDILSAIRAKHEKNKARKWAQSTNGVYHHIKTT